MAVSSSEQYRRADIIIDAVCKVGNIDYLQFITEPRSVKLSTLRGIACILSWEYDIHPRKIAKLIQRSRANVINQTNRYRSWLNNGDKLTIEYYNKVKEELTKKIQ